MQTTDNTAGNHGCVCSNCQAPLSVNPMAELAKCDYCDTVYAVSSLLNESTGIREEKVRARIAQGREDSLRAQNEETRRREMEWQLHKEKSEALSAFKRGKLSKALIGCAIFSALNAAVGFSDGKPLPALILSAQTIIFAVSWLMGMQIVKEPRENLHTALAIGGFLLYIAFLATA